MTRQRSKLGWAMAMAMAVAMAAGCKKDGVASGGGTTPRTTSAAIGTLLAAVPGDALAVGFIDLADPPWADLIAGYLVPLDADARAALDRDLRAYLGRTLGLDLSKIQYAVGFAAGLPPHGAVLIKSVSGDAKLPGAIEAEGAKLWRISGELTLAIRGDTAVFGDEAGVRAALAVLAGKAPGLTAAHKELVDWFAAESRGAAIAVAAVRPTGAPLPPQIAGLSRAVVTAGASGLRAVVEGDDASLGWLQRQLDEAVAAPLAELERARAAAVAGQLGGVEGASAIFAAANAKAAFAQLRPRRVGLRLETSLSLGRLASGGGGALTAVSVIGIVAAVAIPAFMDYMKRSKQSEPALQLNRIGKRAKAAYAEGARFPSGEAQRTPSAPCCGQPNNHCAAVPERYAASPVWRALDFSIDEATLFQYSYRGAPDGQSFVAEAVGDLDCDGVAITYRLIGSVEGGVPRVELIAPPPNAD